MMLSPFNSAPFKDFYPFPKTSATQLTQHLPANVKANCLLLSTGDPRHILYTIHREQEAHFKRELDFTCCDETPAILARNVILYTILLDNADTKTKFSYYWNLFYDFSIDRKTLSLIRTQAAKLVRHSKNMQAWIASGYSDVLCMVNSDTLKALRQCWLQYHSPANSSEERRRGFVDGSRTTYSPLFEQDNLIDLRLSFGVMASKSSNLAKLHAKQFCQSASEVLPNLSSEKVFMNPLFAYPSGADNFAIHGRAHPMTGFHVASAICEVTSDSPHREMIIPGLEAVAAQGLSLVQFTHWCESFREFVHESRTERSQKSLRIRLFVGDGLAFCCALNHLRTGVYSHALACYAQPWSGSSLHLDGPNYQSVAATEQAPLTFNVVDTSDLTDTVGLVNLLVSVLPVLEQSPATVLWTDTTFIPDKGQIEASLLPVLLNGDVHIICLLLGIAPKAYLTGCTTRAYEQDVPEPLNPPEFYNRIAWTLVTSGDSAADPQQKVSCDPGELGTLLFEMYGKMFIHENKAYAADCMRYHQGKSRFSLPLYTRRGFAAFIAFIKSRVSADWSAVMNSLTSKLIAMYTSNSDISSFFLQDLYLELYLLGVQSLVVFQSGFQNIRDDENRVMIDGITCVILTIPRAEIQPWHEAYVKAGRGDPRRYNMTFQLSLIARKFKYDQIFSGTLPLFGKLNVRGRNATLEHDSKGWEGQSDLHICTYVPAEMVRRIKPENIIVSVRLMTEISAPLATHHKPMLTDKQCRIFRAPMLNETYVHLVNSLPGLESPSPTLIASPVKSPTIIDMSYPELQISKKTFTTRLTFRHDSDRKHLQNSNVTVKQITPCTITIANGVIQYCFSFPFPIIGNQVHIRISKRLSYIEVEAPLWSHSDPNVGGYSTNPFPVVRDSDGTLCNWNMSSVNHFVKVLPMLDLSRSNSQEWLDKHLSSMFSARERQLIRSGKPDNITSLRVTLQQIFTHIMDTPNRVIEIRVSRESRASMFFFFTGMFLDDNTHGVVAEAYVLITTPDSEMHNSTAVISSKSIVLVVGERGVSHLKKVLPAMVERARNYDHKSDCEYSPNKAPPLSVELEGYPICSCGNGKVSKEILDVKEWHLFTVAMTRCAISPIFAAPFVEDTRVFGERKRRSENVDQTHSDERKCAVCGKEGTKKCGQCMKIWYCSRECQRRDWKDHKKNCGPTDESVTGTFPKMNMLD